MISSLSNDDRERERACGPVGKRKSHGEAMEVRKRQTRKAATLACGRDWLVVKLLFPPVPIRRLATVLDKKWTSP